MEHVCYDDVEDCVLIAGDIQGRRSAIRHPHNRLRAAEAKGNVLICPPELMICSSHRIALVVDGEHDAADIAVLVVLFNKPSQVLRALEKERRTVKGVLHHSMNSNVHSREITQEEAETFDDASVRERRTSKLSVLCRILCTTRFDIEMIDRGHELENKL